MTDLIEEVLGWTVTAFFVFVVVTLPFGLLGGALYLVRVVWGLE